MSIRNTKNRINQQGAVPVHLYAGETLASLHNK